MLGQRQAGEAYAYELAALVLPSYEPQRHHGAVIERGVTLAERPRGETLGVGKRAELFPDFGIVLLGELHLRRAELPERARGFAARRNVEVIRVHHGMRAGDNERILKLMSIESVMPSNHPRLLLAFNLSQHQGLFQ